MQLSSVRAPDGALTQSATGKGRWPRAAAIAALIVVNGLLLAVTLALSRQAQGGGLSPVAYGFWMCLGGGALLGMGVILRPGRRTAPPPVRYWLTSGLLSIAAPQLLIFIAVGKIGAGLAAIAFALPTLTTWLLARMLGLEGHSWIRMLGVVVGAAGATLLLAPSSNAIPAGATPWMALILIAPMIIGGGNIYRRVAWPPGAHPLELAMGMLLAAALMFLLVAIALGSDLAFWRMAGASTPVLVQMVVAAAQFLAYFALQRLATPVFFSLIGQVALVFGLVIGALLGESYTSVALGAVGIMFAGLLCVVLGKPRQPDRRARATA